jgi:hypothetical protein
MKTLSIQQPWASLVAAGIKDVENRTWDTKYRGKFLIHASSKKVPKDFEYSIPLEWGNEIINQRIFNNIPDLPDLPTSAIIGYVELVDIVDNSKSMWAAPEQLHWILKNAYLFDEPILDVKGKLHLFDYPIDEDSLPPAHQVKLRQPILDGTTLILPSGDEDCAYLSEDKEINLIQLERSKGMDLLFDCKDELRKLTKIKLEGATKTFEADIEDAEYVTSVEEDGETPIKAWSVVSNSEVIVKQIWIWFKR